MESKPKTMFWGKYNYRGQLHLQTAKTTFQECHKQSNNTKIYVRSHVNSTLSECY